MTQAIIEKQIELSIDGWQSRVVRRTIDLIKDLKREGLYRTTTTQYYADGNQRSFSEQYGKKWQADIKKQFNIK